MRRRHWSYQGERNRNAIIAMHLPCAIAGPGCTGLGTEVDHIVARILGGPDIMANLRPACEHCNRAKGWREAEGPRQASHRFFRDRGYRRAPLLSTPPQNPRWTPVNADAVRRRDDGHR